MSVPTISYNETLYLENTFYVDDHALVEFKKNPIPLAIHYPLFDDAKRSYIGMLYHTQDRKKHFWKLLMHHFVLKYTHSIKGISVIAHIPFEDLLTTASGIDILVINILSA